MVSFKFFKILKQSIIIKHRISKKISFYRVFLWLHFLDTLPTHTQTHTHTHTHTGVHFPLLWPALWRTCLRNLCWAARLTPSNTNTSNMAIFQMFTPLLSLDLHHLPWPSRLINLPSPPSLTSLFMLLFTACSSFTTGANPPSAW